MKASNEYRDYVKKVLNRLLQSCILDNSIPVTLSIQLIEQINEIADQVLYDEFVPGLRGVVDSRKDDQVNDQNEKFYKWLMNKKPLSKTPYIFIKEFLAYQSEYYVELFDLKESNKKATTALEYCSRGLSKCSLGRTEEGIADINKSIELEPGLSDAWFSKAKILYKQGLRNEALRHINVAIELEAPSKHWDNFLFRSRLYIKQKKYDLALEDAIVVCNLLLSFVCTLRRADSALTKSRKPEWFKLPDNGIVPTEFISDPYIDTAKILRKLTKSMIDTSCAFEILKKIDAIIENLS